MNMDGDVFVKTYSSNIEVIKCEDDIQFFEYYDTFQKKFVLKNQISGSIEINKKPKLKQYINYEEISDIDFGFDSDFESI